METTIFLRDSTATHQLGLLLGQFLPAGSNILLEGELGAGKTTLVQGIASGLGISESVVSPTFTLINEYTDGRIPLYHLDLYRLEPSQVTSIYPEIYWEGIELEPGITAIEWQERLSYKPANYIKIKLSDCAASGRKARIKQVGSNPISLDFLDRFSDLETN